MINSVSYEKIFLAHLFYQPQGLIQSCFVCHASLLLASFVHTFPSHRFKEASYLVHICTYDPHVHIKYLVILTCSF